MNTMSYSDFRKNLTEAIEKVNNDHSPVMITREKKLGAVLISIEDYKSLQETNYLFSSPANAKRLMESEEQLKKGEIITKDISFFE